MEQFDLESRTNAINTVMPITKNHGKLKRDLCSISDEVPKHISFKIPRHYSPDEMSLNNNTTIKSLTSMNVLPRLLRPASASALTTGLQSTDDQPIHSYSASDSPNPTVPSPSSSSSGLVTLAAASSLVENNAAADQQQQWLAAAAVVAAAASSDRSVVVDANGPSIDNDSSSSDSVHSRGNGATLLDVQSLAAAFIRESQKNKRPSPPSSMNTTTTNVCNSDFQLTAASPSTIVPPATNVVLNAASPFDPNRLSSTTSTSNYMSDSNEQQAASMHNINNTNNSSNGNGSSDISVNNGTSSHHNHQPTVILQQHSTSPITVNSSNSVAANALLSLQQQSGTTTDGVDTSLPSSATITTNDLHQLMATASGDFISSAARQTLLGQSSDGSTRQLYLLVPSDCPMIVQQQRSDATGTTLLPMLPSSPPPSSSSGPILEAISPGVGEQVGGGGFVLQHQSDPVVTVNNDHAASLSSIIAAAAAANLDSQRRPDHGYSPGRQHLMSSNGGDLQVTFSDLRGGGVTNDVVISSNGGADCVHSELNNSMITVLADPDVYIPNGGHHPSSYDSMSHALSAPANTSYTFSSTHYSAAPLSSRSTNALSSHANQRILGAGVGNGCSSTQPSLVASSNGASSHQQLLLRPSPSNIDDHHQLITTSISPPSNNNSIFITQSGLLQAAAAAVAKSTSQPSSLLLSRSSLAALAGQGPTNNNKRQQPVNQSSIDLLVGPSTNSSSTVATPPSSMLPPPTSESQGPTTYLEHLNPDSKDIRRRVSHNEVERRRRDRINTWISELHKLLPADEQAKSQYQSKGVVLKRVCEYFQNVDSMLKAANAAVEQAHIENSLLRQRLRELEQDNKLLSASWRLGAVAAAAQLKQRQPPRQATTNNNTVEDALINAAGLSTSVVVSGGGQGNGSTDDLVITTNPSSTGGSGQLTIHLTGTTDHQSHQEIAPSHRYLLQPSNSSNGNSTSTSHQLTTTSFVLTSAPAVSQQSNGSASSQQLTAGVQQLEQQSHSVNIATVTTPANSSIDEGSMMLPSLTSMTANLHHHQVVESASDHQAAAAVAD